MKLDDINNVLEEMAWADIKLSAPSKMGHIPSWSLQAGTTCPGATCPSTGETKPACKSCYAPKGNYKYPSVKNLRSHNQKDWKRKDWEADMIGIISDYGRFRWFDSGDMYSPQLINKIINIAKKTPRTQHWIPTMSHNVPKFAPLIDKLAAMKNVTLRRSSGQVDGSIREGEGSTIIDKKTALKMFAGEIPVPKGAKLCPVGLEPGRKKCETCRICYDKKVKSVIYAKH